VPPELSFEGLLAVAAVAVLAPLVAALAPRLRVPAVVLEIVAGVLVGPSVLGVVQEDQVIAVLALLGLAFLLFLAGLEIDLRSLRGRRLAVGLAGFAVSLAIGSGAGVVVAGIGWADSPLLLALTLSATGLGLVVPVLKDAGRVRSDVGQAVVTSATVADFGAILLLSVLFSASSTGPAGRLGLLGGFVALVAVVVLVLSRAARWRRLGDLLVALQDTTAEIRVRAAVLLVVALAVLAERSGLESILGAFLAGALVAAVDRDATTHPRFRAKLDAVGYGFLVPVFFVASGIRLDLRGLLEDPAALVRVPVYLLLLLLVRGVPALLLVRSLGRRPALAAALLQATSLPFVVAATAIGVELGVLGGVDAAALVAAGLLSVLLFPPLALALLGPPVAEPAPDR
jgi:Kef-type K+ transport system membrane component KefB